MHLKVLIAETEFLMCLTLVSWVEGAVAGATAGVVVETALYPIDTIKTRLQVEIPFKFYPL